MSEIQLVPIEQLGENFVPDEFSENDETHVPRGLPFGSRESDWRELKPGEIAELEARRNRADNWGNLRVKDGFNPARVEDCRFYGLVRIGSLSNCFIEYHDLRLPVGLSRSTIISCDIGDDVAIHNVGYLGHYRIAARCTLFNVNEMLTTSHAKFGNGVVIVGEEERVRIWLEIANENGGRKVMPFDGMLPSDAWIWSKYRDDTVLMDRFASFTEKIRDSRRGLYGEIGEETVIKECRILKDVKVGSQAYIKGSNKLKNLTINSDADRPTQIGEGCELVNGIIGYGCRAFYGVKAVRFILCDHSNLKYGARLINSVLGSNSTISCCEVLNSLIFGAHEQHHNSSFLCASVLKGQSNMASAATVGSNHNSRAGDGEIIADRGFWPGLMVSLKHNSRFAAFTLIVKGSYPAEMDIPLPFTMVSNNASDDELVLMPGYWFRYNMYALARNGLKITERDKRLTKPLLIESDWLAPDTVNQMMNARLILEQWAEDSPEVREGSYSSGRAMLCTEEKPTLFASDAYVVESSQRRVRILHAGQAYRDYLELSLFYTVNVLIRWAEEVLKTPPGLFLAECVETANKSVLSDAKQLTEFGPEPQIDDSDWENIGGQLIKRDDLEQLKRQIKNGEIDDWPSVHQAYQQLAEEYPKAKYLHAQHNLVRFFHEERADSAALQLGNSVTADVSELLDRAEETNRFLLQGIIESRRKDYEHPFRNLTYDSPEERDAVLGKFEENEFVMNAMVQTDRTSSRIAHARETL